VGAPIAVEGRVWGTVVALSATGEPLPPDTEARLSAFTELVGVAIADTQAREELRALAEEQAALRRVATLVAEDAPPAELFRAPRGCSAPGRRGSACCSAPPSPASPRSQTTLSFLSRPGQRRASIRRYPSGGRRNLGTRRRRLQRHGTPSAGTTGQRSQGRS